MIFDNQPIRKKLIGVILLITTISSLIICGISIAYKMITLRYDMVKNSTTLAQITAYNTTAALAFSNEKDANTILSALVRDPHIISAGLYKTNGELFASYFKDATITNTISLPTTIEKNGYHFKNPRFEIWQSVEEDDKKLGVLFIEYDLNPIYKRIELYTGVILLTMVVSWFISFLLAIKIQKNISYPIISLTETAKEFVSSKNDAIRATKLTNDEIGTLADAFNQMLDHIQDRNNALKESGLIKEVELKKLVLNRTLELEQTNKELESFSYSVSHDLRAPLRIIEGYSQMLKEDLKDKIGPESENIIKTIENEVQRMRKLIDELLNLSRLNRQQMNFSEVDATEICRMAYQDIHFLSSDRNIQFNLKPLPSLWGDETLIRQVFTNILSNAVKFTRNQKNTIIEVGSKIESNEVIYYIKDNGIGFDMKFYDKLFGVFQRLHKQNEFEGNGIGLALVKRIIQRHGGRIWAEGEVNTGATFYFTVAPKPS